MKKLIFILIALISFSQAQTIQTIGAPTTTVVSRGNFRTDSIFYLPKRSKTPTDTAAFRYQISDSSLYYWTGYQWTKVQSASSFASVDTTVISTRRWRQKGIDSVQYNVGLKVNISDTSTMLSPYIRHAGYGLTKSGQALSVDTALMATRLRVGKVVDSLSLVKQNVLTNPVTGTGTTNYVPKFTGTSTIGNSSIIDNGSQIITNLTDIRLGNAVSTTDVSLKLGRTRTNNGFVFIDLIGDTTYSDYGFRLIRGNTGLNATSSLEHRGTGTFTINANESANVRINTSATERFTVLSTGNIGIGNTSPTSILTVGSNNSASTTPTSIEMDRSYRTGGIAFDKLKFYLYKDGTQSYGFGLGDLADVQYWAGSSSTGIHRFFTSQTERARLTSSGELLINTTTDAGAYTLQNNGALYNNGTGTFIGNGSTSPANIIVNTIGATGTQQLYSDYNASGGVTIVRMSRGNGASGLTANGLNIDNYEGFQVRVNQLGGTGGSINFLGGESIFGTTTDAGNYRVQVSGNAYVSGIMNIATSATNTNATLNVNGNIFVADENFFKLRNSQILDVYGIHYKNDGSRYPIRIVGDPDPVLNRYFELGFYKDRNKDSTWNTKFMVNFFNAETYINTTSDAGDYKLQVTGDSYFNGIISTGTASPSASAQLDVTSTTRGFLPPRMTSTQRDAISSPAAGLVIYNTTTSKLQVYTTSWTDLH